jgi:hypothetical protein
MWDIDTQVPADAAADADTADRSWSPRPAQEVGLFQDIPGWIWKVFLGGWATFFGIMLVFFATSPTALFMVTVSALFALMLFGLTKALSAQSRCGDYSCEGAIETHTGPLSPRAAGVQIALIPVAVVIGLIGFVVLAR